MAVVLGLVAGAAGPGVAPLQSVLATARATLSPYAAAPRYLSPMDVMALQMFSTQRGVAVAADQVSRRDYLAVTSDGGVTWQVTGGVPYDVSPSTPVGLDMAFVSPGLGYLRSIGSTGSVAIEFTSDAGRNWSRLESPGTSSGLSFMGGNLWTVAITCPSTSHRASCRPELVIFSPGSTRPASEQAIPTLGIPSSVDSEDTASQPALLDRLSRSAGVFGEQAPSGRSSLIETLDSGQRWKQLTNPCHDLDLTSLVRIGQRDWYLYCALDEGMNQGRVALYTSTDNGRNWQPVAAASEQSATIGTIGGGIGYDLTASGNGRLLWLPGAVGGLELSTDGGRNWSGVPVSTGGAGTVLATAGQTEAWFPAPFVCLFRTLNGKAWSRLR